MSSYKGILYMIKDDGDFVRGCGFLAVYSSYLEHEIRKIIKQTKIITRLADNIEKFGLTAKIESLCRALEQCFDNAPDYDSKDDVRNSVLNRLNETKRLYKERNRYLHSVHISDQLGEITQNDPRDQSSFKMKSSDVYNLANDIFKMRGELLWVRYRLRDLYAEINKSKGEYL